MKTIQGSWTESSSGQTARNGAEVLGKEGHAWQGKALNLIGSVMGNHRKVLSQRVARSNSGFRKFSLAAEQEALFTAYSSCVGERTAACAAVAAVWGTEGVGQRDILEVDLTELSDEDMKKRNISKAMTRFWV